MLDRAEVVTKGGDSRDISADLRLFGVVFAAVLAVPVIVYLGLVATGGADAGALLHAVAGMSLEEPDAPAVPAVEADKSAHEAARPPIN